MNGAKKKGRIIFDCDDVLRFTNEYAIWRLNKETGAKHDVNDISGWGLLGNELDQRLAYFSDEDFVRGIPFRPEAAAVMSALDEFDIIVATDIPKNCAAAQYESIITHLPVDPSNVIIGKRKDLFDADVIIDDNPNHLENARARYAVLFRQPWNSHITGIPTVSDLWEFKALIDILFGKDLLLKAGPKVIALVGPSASGKSTIADRLLEGGGFGKMVSYTTRKPRYPDEKCYHFVSRDTFLRMKKNGEFMETSTYMGELYGSTKVEVQRQLDKGKHVVAAIDINGSFAMKKHFPGRAVSFFVKRNKEKILHDLLGRDLSHEDTVKRILALDAECRNEVFCDQTIDNDSSIEKAVNSIREVLKTC